MNAPEKITAHTLAAKAADRWAEHYSDYMDKRKETEARLRALGPNPDPASVNAVVGNTSWTQPPDCTGCGHAFAAVVRVGQPPDYESRTAYLCAECLGAAARALDLAVVPRTLTAENGAKAAFMGETFACFFVPWTAIKAVHRAVVAWAEHRTFLNWFNRRA